MAWDGAGDPWTGTDEGRRLTKMLARAERESDEGAAVAFLYAHRLMRRMEVGLVGLMHLRDDIPGPIDAKTYARLRKVLSLASSDTEGEAIAAFLMARRLLQRAGLTLGQVMALPDDGNPDATYEKCYPTLEVEVIALRKRVRELSAEVADKRQALKRYETALETMVDNAWALHQSRAGLLEDGTERP